MQVRQDDSLDSTWAGSKVMAARHRNMKTCLAVVKYSCEGTARGLAVVMTMCVTSASC